MHFIFNSSLENSGLSFSRQNYTDKFPRGIKCFEVILSPREQFVQLFNYTICMQSTTIILSILALNGKIDQANYSTYGIQETYVNT